MRLDHLKSAALFLAAGLCSVVVAYLLIELLMVRGIGLSYGDSARLFQAIGAITVIFVGGTFAYWRLQIFRTFEPHLSISHEVSHRQIGERYVHIALTSKLLNNSKVKIELRRAVFSIPARVSSNGGRSPCPLYRHIRGRQGAGHPVGHPRRDQPRLG